MLRVGSFAAQYSRRFVQFRGSVGSVSAGELLVRCNDHNKLGRCVGAGSRFHTDTRPSPQHSTTVIADRAGLEGSFEKHQQTSEKPAKDVERAEAVLEEGPGGPRLAEEGMMQQLDDVDSLLVQMNHLTTMNAPGTAQKVVELLDAGRSRGIKDLRVYSAVFTRLSTEATKGPDITRLAQLMKEDGVEPDLDTYNAIIYGYANSKDPQRAQRAYEELFASGLQANSMTLSNLVVAHSWGSISDMNSCVDALRERGMTPSKVAYQSILDRLRRIEDWEGIRETIQTMLTEDVLPSKQGWAAGFQSAQQLADPEFAKMLLARRSQAGMPPTVDFFVRVMATLKAADRPQEVLEYWRQLVCMRGFTGAEIRPETFFLALRSAVKIRAWEEIETIIGMMQDEGKRMDEKVHNILIGSQEGEVSPRDVERLMSILSKIGEHSGLGLTSLTKMKLASMCVRAKMFDRAMPLFEAAMNTGLRPGRNDWRPLLQTLLALGKPEEVREEWRQASYKRKNQSGPPLLQLFMNAAQQLKDADLAAGVIRQSLKRKLNHRSGFFPIAVELLAEAGRPDEAFKIAEFLRTGGGNNRKLPPFSYRTLCNACMKVGDKQLIIPVVQMMLEEGIRAYMPPPTALSFVIEAFTEAGKAREAIGLFEAMRAREIQPEPGDYVLLADAAVAAHDRPKAAFFVEMAQKGGLQPSERAVAFAQESQSNSISGSSSNSSSSRPLEEQEGAT